MLTIYEKKKEQGAIESSLDPSSIEDEDTVSGREFVTIREDDTHQQEETRNKEYETTPERKNREKADRPNGYHQLIKSCFKNGVTTP
jgi:hypothetical protein